MEACEVFLPGERELRNVMRILSADLAQDIAIHPIRALDFYEQKLAIALPQKGARCFGNAIAETSLTIGDHGRCR